MSEPSYPTTNTNTARQTLEHKQQSFLILKQARASVQKDIGNVQSENTNNNNVNQQTESSPATQPRRLERSESISVTLDKRIGLKVIDCQLHNSTEEKYVVFVLEVEDLETGTQWSILRRYTQIYNLHLKLVDLLVSQGNKLPVSVPPRRLFGRFSLEFVEKRAKMLQEYFDSLLALSSVQESDELIDFLDPSLDVEPGVSPAMWSRPDKEGFLVKQGHFVKNWKERWFILQGNLLFYFKNKPTKEMEPLGIVPLGYCTVEVCSSSQTPSSPGRKYLFEIRNTHLAGEKDYLIQAKSQTDMEDWVQALRMAKVNYMKDHFTLDEQVRRQFEDSSMLTEFSATSSKSSDKLRAYVMATQRARKVNAIASKFDILSFSHSPLSNAVAKYVASPDGPENIIYYDPADSKDINIKGGTVDKLIEKLTDPSATDIRYIMAFLLTYRSFTTPTYLLDLLIQIFDYYSLAHRKKGKSSEPPTADNTVHIRVGLVMKKWLECHFYDFVEDLELTNKLLAFIDNMRNERKKYSAFNLKSDKHDDNNELLKTALVLKSAIKKNVFPKNKNLVSEQYLQNAPPVILPTLFNKNAFDFIDLDPLEIARQLAILEFELFHKVTPKEFLNQRWNKSQKEKEAPNIYAIIKRFNQFSFWVSSVIVKVKDVKPRAAMIKKFIDIAQHSFDLNNLTSTMEICAGLESSGIFRLRKTWQLLPPETVSKFESTKLALGAEKNYKAYRETLHRATGACVPYMGVYLQDLTFIEDGNPDFIKGTELVNFEKRVMVSKVISEIQQFQQLPYCLRPQEDIQRFFLTVEPLPQDDIFSLSQQCEPRARLNE